LRAHLDVEQDDVRTNPAGERAHHRIRRAKLALANNAAEPLKRFGDQAAQIIVVVTSQTEWGQNSA